MGKSGGNVMSYRRDIKDGKVRYKYRYREYDPNKNKVVQRETKWCKTQKEAYALYLEHIQGLDTIQSEKTLEEALGEYLDILKSKAERVTSAKKSTDYTYYTNCRALARYYVYEPIRKLSTSELKPRHFALWLEYINSDTMGHKSLTSNRISALRTQISQFSSWLVLKGYVFEGFDISVNGLMSKLKLKSRKEYSRRDRKQPKYKDINTICDYYRPTLYNFDSLYWFVLFRVLFYTGMRVCELVALKWCNIDFDYAPDIAVIKIRDSISEKEKREDVKRRHAAGNFLTKNSMSVRNLTMFENYRGYLEHYCFAYMINFNMDRDEIDNCYVFPNITSRTNKLDYQDHGNILYQLNKVCSKMDLPKFDPQMFRHGFVFFLAHDIHLPIDQAYKLLGHVDSDMIKEVYLNMNIEESREFVSDALKDLISEDYGISDLVEDINEVNYKNDTDPFMMSLFNSDIAVYYEHLINKVKSSGSNVVYINRYLDSDILDYLKEKLDLTDIVFEELDII